jgi:hypothetical protein
MASTDGGVLELNVGGEILVTTRSTLCQFPHSLLGRMFSGDWDEQLSLDAHGRVFLVRHTFICRAYNLSAVLHNISAELLPQINSWYSHGWFY